MNPDPLVTPVRYILAVLGVMTIAWAAWMAAESIAWCWRRLRTKRPRLGYYCAAADCGGHTAPGGCRG